MKKFFLFVFVCIVLLMAVIRYNAHVETEEFQLYSHNLPAEFDGFRVLLLSDLHGRSFGEDNAELLDKVTAAEPDLIALTGDLLDKADQVEQVTALARGLVGIAPCYYVTGNHEWAAGCVKELKTALTEAGVTVLDDDAAVLERDGARIVAVGLCDPNGNTKREEQLAFLSNLEADYILLLNHRNEPPETFENVQAVLSGHAHGGVIRLPLIGGLLGTDRRLFPQYTDGLYSAGETELLVSRGLGGARIFCRPHLPVAVLRQEK